MLNHGPLLLLSIPPSFQIFKCLFWYSYAEELPFIWAMYCKPCNFRIIRKEQRRKVFQMGDQERHFKGNNQSPEKWVRISPWNFRVEKSFLPRGTANVIAAVLQSWGDYRLERGGWGRTVEEITAIDWERPGGRRLPELPSREELHNEANESKGET